MLASLPRSAWWLLALSALTIWLGPLDVRKMLHPDEGRYAEIAREMAVSGDFVTPRLNDLKYFEKPPLQYWVGAAAFEVLGVNEWTARLPAALAGLFAVLAVGFAGARLVDGATGAYAALVLVGAIWHAGIGLFLSLDSMLSFWLALTLCAFLLAQRPALSATAQRALMLAAYAAAAGATLTKGLIGLVIPGGALVAYTLATRDTGPWRRLHLLPGLAVFLILAAPWFILVSNANPEFARFFFIHEHFQRFLTTSHNREGDWYYFVPWFVVGMMPWLLIWAVTLPRSWRQAPIADNGFSWGRFCIAWAAFVFIFFSASGSKLPGYILPMFPALALVLGFELTRTSSKALSWLVLPLVICGPLLLLAYLGYAERLFAQIATERTPIDIFRMFKPWAGAALVAFSAAGIVAFALFRNGGAAAKTLGIAALSLFSLLGLQVAFLGHDVFRETRSSWDILAAAQRTNGGPLDPAFPVFQVASYDQTLPFYLQRPTPPVEYRDEMTLGIIAEPHKAYHLHDWINLWEAAPQAYALMSHDKAAELLKRGVPLRTLARDTRRVFVSRR